MIWHHTWVRLNLVHTGRERRSSVDRRCLETASNATCEEMRPKHSPVARGHSLDRLMTATNPKGKYSATEYRSLYRSPKRFQAATAVQEPEGEKEVRHTAELSVEEEQDYTDGRT